MQYPVRRGTPPRRAAQRLAPGLVMAALALVASPWPALALSPPESLRGEFPIGKDGRFLLLPVQIADREVLCMVDTGAALCAFDMKLKSLFGKPLPERVVDAPGTRARVAAFEWPQVKLGTQTLKSSKPLAGVDLESLRQATNEEVYGVLGMDVLGTSRLQIDFDRGVLRFLDRIPASLVARGERIPIRFSEDGTPHLEGMIGEDQTERFLIDTGAQGNSLEQDLFDQLVEQGRLRLGSSFASVTIAGDARGERGRLDHLMIGEFTHKSLRFSRVRMSSLGLRYLSRFRLTFDFPDRCLYLQPGAQFERPEPQATSGLMLKWVDGAVRVDSVRENGPAATAGIKPGDVLVQVDGRPAPDDPFALRELLTSRGGKTIALTIRRVNRQIDFRLVLDED